MITITLGTIAYPFNRVIIWVSTLLEKGIISEPIFIQHGISDISLLAEHPLVEAVSVVESKYLTEKMDSSRLVISHAGQGSTRTLASRGCCFVLLPRLARYGEHIDDHQLMFAQSIEQFGIPHCSSLQELEQFILSPPPRFQKQLFSNPQLSDYLLQIHPA